jgi:hypothetical protein
MNIKDQILKNSSLTEGFVYYENIIKKNVINSIEKDYELFGEDVYDIYENLFSKKLEWLMEDDTTITMDDGSKVTGGKLYAPDGSFVKNMAGEGFFDWVQKQGKSFFDWISGNLKKSDEIEAIRKKAAEGGYESEYQEKKGKFEKAQADREIELSHNKMKGWTDPTIAPGDNSNPGKPKDNTTDWVNTTTPKMEQDVKDSNVQPDDYWKKVHKEADLPKDEQITLDKIIKSGGDFFKQGFDGIGSAVSEGKWGKLAEIPLVQAAMVAGGVPVAVAIIKKIMSKKKKGKKSIKEHYEIRTKKYINEMTDLSSEEQYLTEFAVSMLGLGAGILALAAPIVGGVVMLATGKKMELPKGEYLGGEIQKYSSGGKKDTWKDSAAVSAVEQEKLLPKKNDPGSLTDVYGKDTPGLEQKNEGFISGIIKFFKDKTDNIMKDIGSGDWGGVVTNPLVIAGLAVVGGTITFKVIKRLMAKNGIKDAETIDNVKKQLNDKTLSVDEKNKIKQAIKEKNISKLKKLVSMAA